MRPAGRAPTAAANGANGQRMQRPRMSTDRRRARPDDAARAAIGILTTDDRLVITSWDAALASMTGIAGAARSAGRWTTVVPDLESRGLLRAGPASRWSPARRAVLAPALHKYLIPCAAGRAVVAVRPHAAARGVGALRGGADGVGLVVTIEDVTERLEREHQLASELRDANPGGAAARDRAARATEPGRRHRSAAGAMADDDWQVRRSAVARARRPPRSGAGRRAGRRRCATATAISAC